MRAKLPLLLLFTMLASSEIARATPETQARDRAMALAGPTPTLSPDATGPGSEAAVRGIVSSYGRAIETQDLRLFLSVMPDIGSEAQRRLRESFKTIGSQEVEMTIASIDIEGDTATVRVSRKDIIDGRQMGLIAQNFHLVRRGSGWRIHWLSVGR